MVTLKADVRVQGIRPEMVLAAMVIASVFEKAGFEAVITSGIEGRHMAGSFHYAGAAMDFRTNHIEKKEVLDGIVAKVKASLGPDFDAVLEVDHLHVEFQPKAPYL